MPYKRLQQNAVNNRKMRLLEKPDKTQCLALNLSVQHSINLMFCSKIGPQVYLDPIKKHIMTR